MNKEKKRTVRLGLFVTTAVLLFTIGVYNIGNRQNLFGSNLKISAIFQNVNGLMSGSNVRFSGINVGSVDEIIILDDSTLQVDMLMERNVQSFLKKDAIASIGTDGLVGNMIINIRPGKGLMPPVEDGDHIKSYARIETDEMLDKLGNTSATIDLLSINLLDVVEKINDGEGSVSTLINDPAMAKDLQLAIRNLRRTTQHLSALSSQLEQGVAKIDEGQGILGYLLNDTILETKINRTVDNLDTLLLQRTIPIMDYLEQSSKDIAATSAELKSIIEQVDLNNGLAGTMLNDSIVSESFKETMQNLNKGSELLNEDLEALRHNFLFRRYFKKQEKKRKKAEKKAEKEAEKAEISVVQG